MRWAYFYSHLWLSGDHHSHPRCVFNTSFRGDAMPRYTLKTMKAMKAVNAMKTAMQAMKRRVAAMQQQQDEMYRDMMMSNRRHALQVEQLNFDTAAQIETLWNKIQELQYLKAEVDRLRLYTPEPVSPSLEARSR
jgi:hypothetical protein